MRFAPLVLFVLACSAAEYDVRIRAMPTSLLEDAARAEVAVVANCLSQDDAGGVTGDPHLFFSLDETPPSLGPVPEGNHGLFARLVDNACNVVAAGCTDIEIEDGESALLEVQVEASTGSACDSDEVCRVGECVAQGGADAATDARRDAGTDAAVAEDAGPSDAQSDALNGLDAPIDATPDVPDAGDPCEGTIVCDDFESGLSGAYDVDVDGMSSIAISRAQAHSGVQSILVHAAADVSGTSFGLFNAFDESQVGERWVRVWFYLPNFVGLTPLSFESGTNAITLFSTGEEYSAIDTFRFPGGDQSFVSRISLRHQVWTCVEVGLDFDGPNTVALFIDGVPAAETTIPLPNAYPQIRFGASYRDPEDPVDYDIFVDDVATSLTRIGCD